MSAGRQGRQGRAGRRIVLAAGGEKAGVSLLAVDRHDLVVGATRQARLNFAITDENAAAIATLCQRLDGLPLALELAAARTRTLHLRWILAGVETAIAVLDPEQILDRIREMARFPKRKTNLYFAMQNGVMERVGWNVFEPIRMPGRPERPKLVHARELPRRGFGSTEARAIIGKVR